MDAAKEAQIIAPARALAELLYEDTSADQLERYPVSKRLSEATSSSE